MSLLTCLVTARNTLPPRHPTNYILFPPGFIMRYSCSTFVLQGLTISERGPSGRDWSTYVYFNNIKTWCQVIDSATIYRAGKLLAWMRRVAHVKADTNTDYLFWLSYSTTYSYRYLSDKKNVIVGFQTAAC